MSILSITERQLPARHSTVARSQGYEPGNLGPACCGCGHHVSWVLLSPCGPRFFQLLLEMLLLGGLSRPLRTLHQIAVPTAKNHSPAATDNQSTYSQAWGYLTVSDPLPVVSKGREKEEKDGEGQNL